MYIISENILQNRRSLLLEVNDFLQYVKEKFSEVLLPVDTITKQELIGKGYKETLSHIRRKIRLLQPCGIIL